jgi:hypothetical protein
MLVGVNAYRGDADAMRRQQTAMDRLVRLGDVEAVNVQFRAEPHVDVSGIETLPVLLQDSITVAGPSRRRKPMTRELFDVLAETAAARGHRYFGYINSDIVVLPAAVETINRLARHTFAVSRCDVDGVDDAGGTPLTSGVDMFVVAPSWWRRHRRRLRSYVVGDACWDNVYTAVMMCHSDGVILNRDRLILHERHPSVWNDATSSARYNGFMAALDARYFSLWCEYWDRLEKGRASGMSAVDEAGLREEVFVWRRSMADALRQSIRAIRARWQFHRLRSAAAASAAVE